MDAENMLQAQTKTCTSTLDRFAMACKIHVPLSPNDSSKVA